MLIWFLTEQYNLVKCPDGSSFVGMIWIQHTRCSIFTEQFESPSTNTFNEFVKNSDQLIFLNERSHYLPQRNWFIPTMVTKYHSSLFRIRTDKTLNVKQIIPNNLQLSETNTKRDVVDSSEYTITCGHAQKKQPR